MGMKKILWKVGVGLLAISVLMFFLLACGGQTEEANKLVKNANNHIEKYNKIDSEIVDLANQIQNLPITTPEGASKGLELNKQMNTKLDEGEKEIEAAKNELEKIKALNVSDEFKTYISMKIDECDLLTQINDTIGELVQEMDKLFQQVATGTATEASINAISQNIDSITKKGEDLKKKREELNKKAQDYHTEHKLGD